MKFALLLFTVGFIFLLLYVQSSTTVSSAISNSYLYAFMAIISLLVVGIFIINDKSSISIPTIVICILIFLIVIKVGSVLYSMIGPVGLIVMGYLINILFFFFLLFFLAIIYQLGIHYLSSLTGYSKIIVSVLFYLPCLLTDFLKYIIREYNITTRITYLLLLMEIIILFLYYYFSSLLQKSNKNYNLLNTKHFLDKKQVIYLPSIVVNDGDDIQTTYSISMWIYTNAPETNRTLFPIFCYGNESNPKPMITYGYDDDSKEYVFFIHFNSNNATSIKIVLPIQRWNHFVFNYDGSMVDLFINGILERSLNMMNIMPIFRKDDSFIIGSDKRGISGAIANIHYNRRKLGAFEVLGLYRLGITTIDL